MYLDVWAQIRSRTSRSLLNSSGSGSGSVAPGVTVPYCGWVASSYRRPSLSDAFHHVSKGQGAAGATARLHLLRALLAGRARDRTRRYPWSLHAVIEECLDGKLMLRRRAPCTPPTPRMRLVLVYAPNAKPQQTSTDDTCLFLRHHHSILITYLALSR
mgnify:CR=1 FL=1